MLAGTALELTSEALPQTVQRFAMHSQVRRAHQPSTLDVVFVIHLATLIVACAFVLMGVSGLLGLDGVEPVRPFVGR